LIAKLAERTAPSGTLKRYAPWICPWQHGQIRYRLTRRGRRGYAGEHVAAFLGPAMTTQEAVAFGRSQASSVHQISEDELDVHLPAMPSPMTAARTAAPAKPRRTAWPRRLRRASR